MKLEYDKHGILETFRYLKVGEIIKSGDWWYVGPNTNKNSEFPGYEPAMNVIGQNISSTDEINKYVIRRIKYVNL